MVWNASPTLPPKGLINKAKFLVEERDRKQAEKLWEKRKQEKEHGAVGPNISLKKMSPWYKLICEMLLSPKPNDASESHIRPTTNSHNNIKR